MLWGQDIKVYTDHKNLTRDALRLTSDRVYHWWLLLEEYAPEIIYIKEIHNTVEDAISRLEYDPKLNKTNEYTHAMLGAEPTMMEIICAALAMLPSNHQCTNTSLDCFHMNEVFANCSDKDELYPLITVEIAAAQRADASLKHLFKRNVCVCVNLSSSQLSLSPPEVLLLIRLKMLH